eukprot:22656_1
MAISEFEQGQSYAVYAVWILISVPTVCYISYQLKENWDEDWLIRRRRVLILIICSLFYYSILIECPCYALARLDISPTYTIAMMQINIINNVSRFWLFSFFVLRIYSLYYDHEYNRTVCKNKWQILINSRELLRQQTWFLANRHRRYGDERWIIIHILIPSTLTYSILYTAGRIGVSVHLDIVHDQYNSFYYLWDIGCTILWIISGAVVSLFFWCKYPKFADTRLIRKEISILLMLLFANLLLVPLFNVLGIIFSVSLSQLGVMSMSVLFCIVLYVMVIYPQSAETRKRQAMKKKITKIAKSEDVQISWQALVSTSKEGYESFMEFLGKELSTENLLFITEYVQVKVAMMRKETLAHKIENDLNLEYGLQLPDTLPVSAIVTEFTDKINEIDMTNDTDVNAICWGAMNRIYVKYIHADLADLEVNISSRRRREIERVYENTKKEKTIESIMGPMERCVIEISILLNDSRSRFGEESVFSELAYEVKRSGTESYKSTETI